MSDIDERLARYVGDEAMDAERLDASTTVDEDDPDESVPDVRNDPVPTYPDDPQPAEDDL